MRAKWLSRLGVRLPSLYRTKPATDCKFRFLSTKDFSYFVYRSILKIFSAFSEFIINWICAFRSQPSSLTIPSAPYAFTFDRLRKWVVYVFTTLHTLYTRLKASILHWFNASLARDLVRSLSVTYSKRSEALAQPGAVQRRKRRYRSRLVVRSASLPLLKLRS